MNRKPALLATVCLAALTINLDTTIVNVALPSLARELDADTRDLLWVVDGYNLAFAALVLAMGSLSDRFGRRPALVVGLAAFATSSGIAALVDSVEALIALRVVMGVSAALIFPTTLSIIANAFTDRRERATALGHLGRRGRHGRRARPDHRRLPARALHLAQRLLGAASRSACVAIAHDARLRAGVARPGGAAARPRRAGASRWPPSARSPGRSSRRRSTAGPRPRR